MKLPDKGLAWPEIEARLTDAKKDDFSWRDGRMALYYYYLDDELSEVQKRAYAAFWTENSLGKRAFPSLAKLEADVVAFGLDLMNAPEGAAGTFTSGGSESIFLAVQTARDWARATKGIERPNFVVPRTAHPAFSRAGHALGVEVRRVPTTRNDFKADVGAIANRIDEGTIGLVGSAPCYPFGVFDPIRELGALAKARGLWLHVDACVGGFLSPYVKRLGHSVPDWDFAVPGVMSVSADLHKHGMAAKGASLFLVRAQELKDKHQLFDFHDWERGPYVSYTMQGTRPGGAVASAWAVLHHLGDEGYMRCARLIMDNKAKLLAGIGRIPGLAVLEPSELSIFVTRSSDLALDVGAVSDAMGTRGWLIGRQAEPPGIHMHLNPSHHRMVDDYLADLAWAVGEARAKGAKSAHAGSTY
ncbi:MAG: aspartate aminotransferase family protein [Alphaproteobacteria bacterium]|nr:aspartate aminotransferase family protein [Alphaproteobacteria bacterium]